MKKKKQWILVIVILSTMGLIISGFSYAKYVSGAILNYYFKTKGFYFTSDYLDINTITNVNNNWDGSKTYFNVKNSLNDAIISDYDINYDVLCTVLGENATSYSCHVNGTNSQEYQGVLSKFQRCSNDSNDGIDVSLYVKEQCESAGYEWLVEEANANLYFEVFDNLRNPIDDVTVNITVTSTSPYQKSINGNFVLKRDLSNDGVITSQYKSLDNYERMIITNTYHTNKCVTMNWNADLFRIDDSQINISSFATDTNGYINEVTFSMLPKSNISYVFYKTNSDVIYNDGSFLVKEVPDC